MLHTFTVLALCAQVLVGADLMQVVCFGADGHVAIERLTSAEHHPVLVASPPDGTTQPMVGSASKDVGVHVDAAMNELGPKSRLTLAPSEHAESAAPCGDAVSIAFASTPAAPPASPTSVSGLFSVRSTVLRI